MTAKIEIEEKSRQNAENKQTLNPENRNKNTCWTDVMKGKIDSLEITEKGKTMNFPGKLKK